MIYILEIYLEQLSELLAEQVLTHHTAKLIELRTITIVRSIHSFCRL